jgi:hypothetical protein
MKAQMSRLRYVRRKALVVALILVGAIGTLAQADNFSSVYYDARTDELVVTMIYRGTNPDHRFSLQWDPCEPLDEQQGAYQIAAEVLDDQWNDAARTDYAKTVRFSLADLQCRPAQVTLRTAPRFYTTVFVPNAS